MSEHRLAERIATREGEEKTSIDLALTAGGGIELSGHDLGPLVQRMQGDGDYEYGIRIRPEDIGHLVFALIAEHYGGDLEAVARVRDLALKYGIEVNSWEWG